MEYKSDLNVDATELRLGLPGSTKSKNETPSSVKSNKRALDDVNGSCASEFAKCDPQIAPPTKTQAVGWPPIRSYRKNCFSAKKSEAEGTRAYIKVSMDGAPYLRKIDPVMYKGYSELLKALENMFKFNVGKFSESEGYNGSEYEPTYEDKDGDWMLVGDVPWEMFINSCKRLRIMKASEAGGLGSPNYQ